MEFGTQKTSYILDGKQVADIVKYRNSLAAKTLRNYRVRVKVVNAQDEMSEFIRFTSELAKLRQEGRLSVDKEDPLTFPAFVIEYPRDNQDGAYFITKCYTIIV